MRGALSHILLTDINLFFHMERKALAKRLDFSLDFLFDKNSRKKSSLLATLLSEALAKRLDFSLDFLLDKKSRKKSSRLATLLSESSGVE